MSVPGQPPIPAGILLPPSPPGAKAAGLSALKIVAIVVVTIVVLGTVALLGLFWLASNLRPSVPPVAAFAYTPSAPVTGQAVTFDASSSYDPDGRIISYTWDFNDGTAGGSGVVITHTFNIWPGPYSVTLTLKDDQGLTNSSSKSVTVAPPPPVVEQTRTVYNGTFTLNAGQYGPTAWSSSSTVSAAEVAHAQNVSGLYNPTLSVYFLASGQTIQVYVMTSTQFYNYQHGAQFSVYYQSGQVYTARQSVMLEPTPETYYVVAENTAFYGQASVSGDFVLHY